MSAFTGVWMRDFLSEVDFHLNCAVGCRIEKIPDVRVVRGYALFEYGIRETPEKYRGRGSWGVTCWEPVPTGVLISNNRQDATGGSHMVSLPNTGKVKTRGTSAARQ